MITVQQLRMARAALNISQSVVAEGIGLNPMAISDIENEKTKNPKASTLSSLQQFYENCGLEFTEAGGVRPNNAEIKIYKGNEGFRNFYHDIYNTIKSSGADIVIQNGMPDFLIKHLGQDYYDMHSKRMVQLKPSVHVLIKEGDKNLIGSNFAKYRTVPAEHFNDQTIYIYGDKTGFITFGDEVEVLVLDNPEITRSLRVSFNVIWENAKDV
jgi:transcriptional regulator with XRE-family HTH domain